MTMEEIQAMTGDWITPATAASAMKMNTGRLIKYAKEDNERRMKGEPPQLPFATRVSESHVLISRKSFLDAYGYGEPEKKEPDRLAEIVKQMHGLTVAITTQNAMLLALLMEMAPGIEKRVEEVIMKTGGMKQ